MWTGCQHEALWYAWAGGDPGPAVQISSGWEDAVAAVKACAGNVASSGVGPAALLAYKDAVLLLAGALGMLCSPGQQLVTSLLARLH